MTDDFDTIINNGNEDSDKSGANIADLEKRLSDLHNKLLEERFLWAVVLILIFDICTFGSMQSWAAPLSIAVIELIFLFILARKCGVEEIPQLFDRVLNTKPLKPEEVKPKE